MGRDAPACPRAWVSRRVEDGVQRGLVPLAGAPAGRPGRLRSGVRLALAGSLPTGLGRQEQKALSAVAAAFLVVQRREGSGRHHADRSGTTPLLTPTTAFARGEGHPSEVRELGAPGS